MKNFVDSIPLPFIFFLALGYFLVLYFGLAKLFTFLRSQYLPNSKIGAVIQTTPVPEIQIPREIRASIVSMIIFALYGVLTIGLERAGVIHFNWNPTFVGAVIELMILFLWNEVHFYACHRLLHVPFFFSKVHYQHHQSKVPTPYSSFSFHWFEAVLLSSVMILVTPFLTLSWAGVIGLPLLSIVGNNIGHLNYDFFPNAKSTSSRRHSDHHKYIHGNFGFLMALPDKILGTTIKK